MGRRLVRLVLPTPDRRRVLARPNGLAGWTLPAVPVDPDDDPARWRASVEAAASRVVGTDVTLVRPVGDDAWEVAPTGRVPRTGVTWIAPEEAARLGADAAVLTTWAALDPPAG